MAHSPISYTWALVRAVTLLLLWLAAMSCKATRDVAGAPPPHAADEVVLGSTSPKLAFISTDTVASRSEKVVATLPAEIVLDETRTVRVASPVVGHALSVDVRAGDVVAKGAALAHLTSGDLAQARSDLAKARATLAQTTAALARTRDLFEHHVAAARDLEQATADEAQARAEEARADARVRGLGESASDIAGAYVLRAPIAGVVVDAGVSAGTEVRPDAPAPLFVISSMDTLWLTANVSQHDLGDVRRGSRLEFTTDAAPGKTFAAHVTYVSNHLDPATRTATVRAELPNLGRALRADVAGEAKLFAPSATSLLVVPTTALVTRGAETVVFVEEQRGRYRRRAVTIADDDGTNATIASGLQPGERVVTAGSILLAAEADRLR